MTNTGKIAMGVMIGTALGAAMGLLFAPEKGSKTRTLLTDKAKSAADSAEKAYQKTKKVLGLERHKAHSNAA